MKVLGIIVLIVIAIAALGNMGDSDESKAAPDTSAPAPTTYAMQDVVDAELGKITSSTDCTGLQETFDRNMSRYEMMDPLVRQQDGSPGEAMFKYANAADDRMRAIDCY